ncbi:MAG: hypothetical protein ACREU3_08700 [Steroidobacteraceae bacterium]
MKIVLTRKAGRSRMTCHRADGTSTSADVGPNLPAHDFAHFVVERALRLPTGFFVNVANGYSIEQLSDPAVIKALGAEPYVAEVLARALGETTTGACRLDQFVDRVAQELESMRLSVPVGLSSELASRMLEELRALLTQFERLRPGESMQLDFDERSWRLGT